MPAGWNWWFSLTLTRMWSISDPKEDDGRCHHDADALQQVTEHVDECGTHACVAMATKERMGVAMTDGALTILINLLITPTMRVEVCRVMKDVGHTAEWQRSSLVTGLWTEAEIVISSSIVFSFNEFIYFVFCRRETPLKVVTRLVF